MEYLFPGWSPWWASPAKCNIALFSATFYVSCLVSNTLGVQGAFIEPPASLWKLHRCHVDNGSPASEQLSGGCSHENRVFIEGGRRRSESGCPNSLMRTHLLVVRPIDGHVRFSKGLIDQLSSALVIIHFINKRLSEHTRTLYRRHRCTDATHKSYTQ